MQAQGPVHHPVHPVVCRQAHCGQSINAAPAAHLETCGCVGAAFPKCFGTGRETRAQQRVRFGSKRSEAATASTERGSFREQDSRNTGAFTIRGRRSVPAAARAFSRSDATGALLQGRVKYYAIHPPPSGGIDSVRASMGFVGGRGARAKARPPPHPGPLPPGEREAAGFGNPAPVEEWRFGNRHPARAS